MLHCSCSQPIAAHVTKKKTAAFRIEQIDLLPAIAFHTHWLEHAYFSFVIFFFRQKKLPQIPHQNIFYQGKANYRARSHASLHFDKSQCIRMGYCTEYVKLAFNLMEVALEASLMVKWLGKCSIAYHHHTIKDLHILIWEVVEHHPHHSICSFKHQTYCKSEKVLNWK